MTIESRAEPIAGRSLPAAAPDHGQHREHVRGHAHGHDRTRSDGGAAAKAGFSPFLASAPDRLALAAVVAGLIWIGVLWAVR